MNSILELRTQDIEEFHSIDMYMFVCDILLNT